MDGARYLKLKGGGSKDTGGNTFLLCASQKWKKKSVQRQSR